MFDHLHNSYWSRASAITHGYGSTQSTNFGRRQSLMSSVTIGTDRPRSKLVTRKSEIILTGKKQSEWSGSHKDGLEELKRSYWNSILGPCEKMVGTSLLKCCSVRGQRPDSHWSGSPWLTLPALLRGAGSIWTRWSNSSPGLKAHLSWCQVVFESVAWLT